MGRAHIRFLLRFGISNSDQGCKEKHLAPQDRVRNSSKCRFKVNTHPPSRSWGVLFCVWGGAAGLAIHSVRISLNNYDGSGGLRKAGLSGFFCADCFIKVISELCRTKLIGP